MKTTILLALVMFAVLLESANSKKRNEKAKNEGAGGDEEWPNPGPVGGFQPPAMFQEAPKDLSIEKEKASGWSHNRTSHSGRSGNH